MAHIPLEILENCFSSRHGKNLQKLCKGKKLILPSEEAFVLMRLELARKTSFTDIVKNQMNDFIETTPRLLEMVTPPASEPVSLSEAKAYLRVDTSDEDTTISNLISAARQMVEGYIRKSLINQTWKLEYNHGVAEQVFLPMGPVQSITSVVLTTREGAQSTLDDSTYYLNASKLCAVFDVTPEEHKITITYVTGFGSSGASVPMAIRQGILACIAAAFDGRDDSEMPEKAVALLAPYRSILV